MDDTAADSPNAGEPAQRGLEECHSVPLDARQEAVALLLAAGRSVADAASETGAGVRTIRRWIAEDAAFGDRVQQFKTELFALAVGRLSNLAGKAADPMANLPWGLGSGCRGRRDRPDRNPDRMNSIGGPVKPGPPPLRNHEASLQETFP